MTVLLIEHLETPWQIASAHRVPNGGGWPNPAALQEYNVARNWHPPLCWAESLTKERALSIIGGVLLERWVGSAWVPFCRLTLV